MTHSDNADEPQHPAVVETRLRVRYAETDQMGVVYHANYFVWFEVGRVEYLRARGFSYKDMEADDDCHIVVVDARCRYKAPARYDDELVIRTRVSRQRGPILYFNYEAVRASDELLLATGETVHVVVDRNFEARQLPEKYRRRFGQTADTGKSKVGDFAPSEAQVADFAPSEVQVADLAPSETDNLKKL